ncbi:hypothetical protein ABZV81_10315 [Streptomyces parvus]|uniref:hypothetical protein n=1 Tax=Streptomyces parvus TaxID=66428 RepID=UPI0033A2965E
MPAPDGWAFSTLWPTGKWSPSSIRTMGPAVASEATVSGVSVGLVWRPVSSCAVNSAAAG